MTGSILRACGAVLFAFATLLGIAPRPAVADCAAPPPIDQAIGSAQSAFVGRVATVSNGNRWAVVAVEEVWVGPDLPEFVDVRGGADPGVASSIDRTYRAGVTYLFVVEPLAGVLRDSSCSSTTEWEPGLHAVRPRTVRAPIASSVEATDPAIDMVPVLVPLAVAGLVGALVFGVAILARRRIG